MKNKISVIIPVYNVESYLKKCVDSVLGQTYKNTEIILIDDGSTDSSPKLCDEYAKKFKNIKVVHKKNEHTAIARNTGIDVATGDYLFFLDSDDFINSKTFELLAKIFETNNVDCAAGIWKNYFDFKETEQNIKRKDEHPIKILEKDYILDNLNNNLFNIVTNNLYKKELFDNLRFEPGIIHEDSLLAPKLYARVNKMACVEVETYYRYVNPNSYTHISFNKRTYDLLKIGKKRIEYFKNDTVPRKINSYKYCLSNITILYKKAYLANSDAKTLKEIKNEYKLVYKESKKYFTLKDKVKYLSFIIVPKIISRILISPEERELRKNK